MLATSRSPLDSRFLFHAKDTALFYAMDSGFFDKSGKAGARWQEYWNSKIEAWKRTVEVQAEHEANQALDWEKPLRHALALMVGLKRKDITPFPTEAMLQFITKRLMRYSSPNGLFPGSLDSSGAPVSFGDELERDGYWHATFELPYIFWKYGRNYMESAAKLTQPSEEHMPRRLPEEQPPLDAPSRRRPTSQNAPQARNLMGKREDFMNYAKLFSQRHLVEAVDDWLEVAPASLDFGFIPDNRRRNFRLQIPKRSSCVAHADLHPTKIHHSGKGVVIDIRKRSDGTEARKSLMTNQELQDALGRKRTVQEAKKRVVWLQRGDKTTQELHKFASSETEKDNLLAFFEQHAAYEQHFSDVSTPAANEWITEMHLSYFKKLVLVNIAGRIHPSSSNSLWIPELNGLEVGLPKPERSHLKNKDPRGEPVLARKTASFRFVGDFADRYWTCHFLQHNPQHIFKGHTATQSSDQDEGLNLEEYLSLGGRAPSVEPPHSSRVKHPWQQRKVLELLLFDSIVRDMATCTEEIWDWTRTMIVESPIAGSSAGNTSILGPPIRSLLSLRQRSKGSLDERVTTWTQGLGSKESNVYFSNVRAWRLIEPILQEVEEDLGRNLEAIREWDGRGDKRGSEKPRWTRNDESTYRGTINKLLASNLQNIHKLEHLEKKIRTFRNSVSGKLVSMREDINFKRSENINLFTYVTVIFLPLSFAASIFSMGGAPETVTIVGMAITSVVALCLTIWALVNAEALARGLVTPVVKPIMRKSGQVIFFVIHPFWWCVSVPLATILWVVIGYPLVYGFWRYLGHPIIRRYDDSVIPWLGIPIWYFEFLNVIFDDPVGTAKKDYEGHGPPMDRTKPEGKSTRESSVQEASINEQKDSVEDIEAQSGSARPRSWRNSSEVQE